MNRTVHFSDTWQFLYSSFGVFLCGNPVLILQQDEKTGEKFCTSVENQARIRIYVKRKQGKKEKES